MSGITNRPLDEEQENQERVREKAREMGESVQGPRNNGGAPTDKNRGQAADDPGRLRNTGAGRGTDHQGH